MRIVLVLLAALVPTSAGAQALWRNVEAGMPAIRVHQLYPAGGPGVELDSDQTTLRSVEQVGKCSADVAIVYADAAVKQVMVRSQFSRSLGMAASLDKCGAEAEALLRRRHGTPDRTATIKENGEAVSVQGWTRDKLDIELRRHGTEPEARWAITYRPADSAQAKRKPGR